MSVSKVTLSDAKITSEVVTDVTEATTESAGVVTLAKEIAEGAKGVATASQVAQKEDSFETGAGLAMTEASYLLTSEGLQSFFPDDLERTSVYVDKDLSDIGNYSVENGYFCSAGMYSDKELANKVGDIDVEHAKVSDDYYHTILIVRNSEGGALGIEAQIDSAQYGVTPVATNDKWTYVATARTLSTALEAGDNITINGAKISATDQTTDCVKSVTANGKECKPTNGKVSFTLTGEDIKTSATDTTNLKEKIDSKEDKFSTLGNVVKMINASGNGGYELVFSADALTSDTANAGPTKEEFLENIAQYLGEDGLYHFYTDVNLNDMSAYTWTAYDDESGVEGLGSWQSPRVALYSTPYFIGSAPLMLVVVSNRYTETYYQTDFHFFTENSDYYSNPYYVSDENHWNTTPVYADGDTISEYGAFTVDGGRFLYANLQAGGNISIDSTDNGLTINATDQTALCVKNVNGSIPSSGSVNLTKLRNSSKRDVFNVSASTTTQTAAALSGGNTVYFPKNAGTFLNAVNECLTTKKMVKEALGSYLTTATAESTYLAQTAAESTYAKKADIPDVSNLATKTEVASKEGAFSVGVGLAMTTIEAKKVYSLAVLGELSPFETTDYDLSALVGSDGMTRVYVGTDISDIANYEKTSDTMYGINNIATYSDAELTNKLGTINVTAALEDVEYAHTMIGFDFYDDTEEMGANGWFAMFQTSTETWNTKPLDPLDGSITYTDESTEAGRVLSSTVDTSDCVKADADGNVAVAGNVTAGGNVTVKGGTVTIIGDDGSEGNEVAITADAEKISIGSDVSVLSLDCVYLSAAYGVTANGYITANDTLTVNGDISLSEAAKATVRGAVGETAEVATATAYTTDTIALTATSPRITLWKPDSSAIIIADISGATATTAVTMELLLDLSAYTTAPEVVYGYPPTVLDVAWLTDEPAFEAGKKTLLAFRVLPDGTILGSVQGVW